MFSPLLPALACSNIWQSSRPQASAFITSISITSRSSSPARSLTASEPGAPTNASVNPATGIFSWTPTQAQSPSTNLISIIVADNSSPPLRTTNSFTVVVNNTVQNSPPLLAPINDVTVTAGATVILHQLCL